MIVFQALGISLVVLLSIFGIKYILEIIAYANDIISQNKDEE